MSSSSFVAEQLDTTPLSWSYMMKSAKAGPNAVAAVADHDMPAAFFGRDAGGGAYLKNEQNRATRLAAAHSLAAAAIVGTKAEWTRGVAAWLDATVAGGAPPSDEGMLQPVALLLKSIVDVGAAGPNLVSTDAVPVDAAAVAAKRAELLAAAGDRAASIATLKAHPESMSLLSLVLGELVWQAEKDELVSAFLAKLTKHDFELAIAKNKDTVADITAADAPDPAGGIFGALAKNVERIHAQSAAARASAVTLQSGALAAASQGLVAAVKEQVVGVNLAIIVVLLNSIGVGAYGGASLSVRDLASTGARQTLLRDWGVEFSHVNSDLEGPGGIKAGGVLDMVPADVRAVLDAGPAAGRDARYQDYFHALAAANSTSMGVATSAVGTMVPLPTCGLASADDARAFYALCDAAGNGPPQEREAVAAQLGRFIQAALAHTSTEYLAAWEEDGGELVAALEDGNFDVLGKFNAAVPPAVAAKTPNAALAALRAWSASAPAGVDVSAELVMSLLLSLKHTPRDASLRRLQMLCVNSAAAKAALQVLIVEKAAADADLADAYVLALDGDAKRRTADIAIDTTEGAALLAATHRSLSEQPSGTLLTRVASLLAASAVDTGAASPFERNALWTTSPPHAAVDHSPSDWETAAAGAYGAGPVLPTLASLFGAVSAEARVGGRLVRGSHLAWRRGYMANLSATRREGGAHTTFSSNALEHKRAAVEEMVSAEAASRVDDVLAAADFYGSGPRRVLGALASVATSVPLSEFRLSWQQGDARVQGGTVYERVHARMDGDKDGIAVCGSQRADSQTNSFITVAPGRKLTVGYDRRWSVQWISGWRGVGAFDCPALRRAAEIVITVNNGPQRRPGVYVAGDVFEKKEYEAAAVLRDVWTPSALRAFYVATSLACCEAWDEALNHLDGDGRFDATAFGHVKGAMTTALAGVVASVALHADLRGWADGVVIDRARAAWRTGGCAFPADTLEARVAELTVAQSFLDDGNGPLDPLVFARPTLDAVLRAARARPGWTRDMDDAFSDAMVAAGGRWPSFDEVWVRAEAALAVFGGSERRITRAHARPLYHAVVAGGLDIVYKEDRFLESGWALQRDGAVDDFLFDAADAAGGAPAVASALALGVFTRRAVAWAVSSDAKHVVLNTNVLSIIKYVHCAPPQCQVGSYCVTRASPLQLLFLVSVATTHSYNAYVTRARVPAADSFASAFDAVVGEEGAWTSVAPVGPPLDFGQRATVGYPFSPALRALMPRKWHHLAMSKQSVSGDHLGPTVSARELYGTLRDADGDPLFEQEKLAGVPVTVGHLLPFCRIMEQGELEAYENRQKSATFQVVYTKDDLMRDIEAGDRSDLGKRFEDAFAAATGANVLDATTQSSFAVLHDLAATAGDVPPELVVPFFSADLGDPQPADSNLTAGDIYTAARKFQRQHGDQVGRKDKREATEAGAAGVPAKKQKRQSE